MANQTYIYQTFYNYYNSNNPDILPNYVNNTYFYYDKNKDLYNLVPGLLPNKYIIYNI